MKTLQRYLTHEIISSTFFVFAALIFLFAFFDLIHELGDLSQGYRVFVIMTYVALSIPGHVYELAPIAALIGTLFVLGRFVTTSEYTVMRVSGISIRRMAWVLIQIGLVFVFITFLVGEFIAPISDRAAQQLRLKATSNFVAQEFRSGLWVKDENNFINVSQLLPNSTLLGVKIFEFDSQHRLRTISFAKEGRYIRANKWELSDVSQTHFEDLKVRVNHLKNASWNSVLNPDILSVLMVHPEQMSMSNLFNYVAHLRENRQQTSRYEIAFWTKLSYPFAILVTMLLALPFAYYQSRSGGMGSKIFTGIMLGLGFYLFNQLSARFGVLYGWPPMFSAMAPMVLFFAAAVLMMWWVERR